MNSAQVIATRLLNPAVITGIAPEINAPPQAADAIVPVIVVRTANEAEKWRNLVQPGTSFDPLARERSIGFRLAVRPRLGDPSASVTTMEFQDTSILR